MTSSKNYFLSILREGETVISITEHVIAVRTVTGEARAYWYHFDKEGVPCLDTKSLMITHGDDIAGMCYECVDSKNLPF